MLLNRLRDAGARLFGHRKSSTSPRIGSPEPSSVDTSNAWKASLERFFSYRAEAVAAAPSLEDLIYISGKEPRLWTQPRLLNDLVTSILEQSGADERSRLLEVGCASGFLARVLAPHVARYTGVDLSAPALDVARRLALPNATFEPSDGGELPFADGIFDVAICYDVFTNFPRFADGRPIISEMIRVVRPGGRILVGPLNDANKKTAFEVRVREVAEDLDREFGPLNPCTEASLNAPTDGPAPCALCYYFDREDFVTLGRELAVPTDVRDIHRMNPYFGYRFNVIYSKPA